MGVSSISRMEKKRKTYLERVEFPSSEVAPASRLQQNDMSRELLIPLGLEPLECTGSEKYLSKHTKKKERKISTAFHMTAAIRYSIALRAVCAGNSIFFDEKCRPRGGIDPTGVSFFSDSRIELCV